MTRELPFGTAQAEVLLKLVSPGGTHGTWSLQDGFALYESRAMTDAVCQRLVRQGYLDEHIADGVCHYRVTEAGERKARQLRKRAPRFAH